MNTREINIFFMSGAGNLFSVVDNRRYNFSTEDGKRIAPALCALDGKPRSEGLMLIDNASAEATPDALDFTMRFFNPDGSFGAMCGNGGRCAVQFAHEHHFFQPPAERRISFTTLGTRYTAEFTENKIVRLFFPPPRAVHFPAALSLESVALTIGITDVGSDHAVVWFDELGRQIGSSFQDFDIAKWGAAVRHHADFPRGANANFYVLTGKQELRLRTFERGVEGETGACGTGAISTALTAFLRHGTPPPITVIPTSGSPLVIDFLPSPDHIEEISLTGGAEILDEVLVQLPC